MMRLIRQLVALGLLISCVARAQSTPDTYSAVVSFQHFELPANQTDTLQSSQPVSYSYEPATSSAPSVTTNAVSSVTSSSAQFNGTINPNGSAATAYFQYGPTTSYGSLTSPGNFGTTAQDIGFVQSGLLPGTTYHYRLVATNSGGTTYGSDVAFTTSAVAQAAPSVTTNAVSSVTSSSAQFNGTINPNGSAATAYFQYGPTTSYGSLTSPGNFGTTAQDIGFVQSGLLPGTTYHYRLVATNSGGTTYGSDVTFTTSPGSTTPAPIISSISPNPVVGENTDQTVTITGTGFVSGMTGVTAWSHGSATLNGPSKIIVDSATQARIFITTETDPDTWTLQFRNPAPDGQNSNVFTFQVISSPVTPPPVTPPPSGGSAPSLTPSMHMASANVIANKESSQGIDDPLELWARQSALLPSQPAISQGLVADGVTPLLFEFKAPTAPAADVDYQLSFNVTDGGALPGGFSPFLRVFQPGASAVFVKNTSTLRLAAGSTTAFAYLTGIDSSNIAFTSGSHVISVTLAVRPMQGTGSTSYLLFKIRRPPIMLVHGYNSSNAAWSLDFQNPLNDAVGSDFVRLIEYGTPDSNPNQPDNTTGTFTALASELDSRLKYELQDAAESFWRRDWAMTRQDIVGHSQGGVLVRMLCTLRNPSSGLAFRSSDNFYRGRFRRVITIDSPHLGSTFAYYLIKASARSTAYASLLSLPMIKPLLQEKFDPWGNQMRDVNGIAWSIDPAAKFHLLTASIYGGLTPPYDPFLSSLDGVPGVYSLTGLCDRPFLLSLSAKSRGATVLPGGSDGVVDEASQFANADTPATDVSALVGANISHCPADGLADVAYDPIFAIAPNHTDTGYEPVSVEIAALLTGPSIQSGGLRVFDSFQLGTYADDLQASIDAVVPGVQTSATITKVSESVASKGARITKSTATPATYRLKIIPDPSEPMDSTPAWAAEVYGQDGITAAGVSVQADVIDPTIVTVSVDSGVTGQVVVFANYGSTTGKLIVGSPLEVVPSTASAAMNGIELLPETTTVSVGSKLPAEVWADYADGTRSELYVPPDASFEIISSKERIAKVKHGRLIVFKTAGKTKLTANYLGFSVTKVVDVKADPPLPEPVQLPVVTIASSVAYAVEATLQPGELTVSRTGDQFGDLTIPYIVKGSAGSGINYQPLSGSVTIPDGSPTATISIVPIDDHADTGNLKVTVRLAPGSGYQLGTPTKAKVTINESK